MINLERLDLLDEIGRVSADVDYIANAQRDTRFELHGGPIGQPNQIRAVINLKTAKTLGVEIPSTLLAIASGDVR